jgi:hypothetical protein
MPWYPNQSAPNLHICGCHYVWNSVRQYLPQVQLISHTTITPLSFTTELTQTFHNSNEAQIKDAQYTFPLYDGVAVNKFTITFGDQVLHGIVKHKADAKQIFQAAVDRNETAGLLESLPAGIFGVTIGNVPAKTDVIVRITYGGELKHDAAVDGLRYTLPTSIAPRYGSYPGEARMSNAVANGGIKISVDLDMASSAIRKIQSPSHPIAVELGQLNNGASTTGGTSVFNPSLASATLALASAELAEDFVLQVLVDNLNNPQAILETHPTLENQRAIMATLVPKFALDPAHPEIVFIADQSGSMQGEKNEALVSALKVFIKSLPFGVRFNICAFGNGFEYLWPKSQAYSEENVANALKCLESFQAQRGGTEILGPIKAAFENRLSDMPLEVMLLTDGQIWREEEVFSYINEQVRDKKANARVFALGVGSDVSHTLVEGVARAGNGFAQFVNKSEETGKKVMRMLKSALYAHTRDYSVEVHYAETSKTATKDNDDDGFELVEKVDQYLHIKDDESSGARSQQPAAPPKAKSFFDSSADDDNVKQTSQTTTDRYAHLPKVTTPEILQTPSDIPPLFPYSRTTVYLLLGPESVQREIASITIRASSDAGPLELNIPVKKVHEMGTNIHQLAARKAVQELEEGRGWMQHATTLPSEGEGLVLIKERYSSRFDELVEREAVSLGEKFQVASKWTSFVAVNKQSQDELPPPVVTATSNALAPGRRKSASVARSGGGASFGAPRSLFAMPAPARAPAAPAAKMFGKSTYAGHQAAVPQSSGFGSVAPSSAAPSAFGQSAFGGSRLSSTSSAPPPPPGGFGCVQTQYGGSFGLFGSASTNSTPPPSGFGSSGGMFGSVSTESTPRSGFGGIGGLFGKASKKSSPSGQQSNSLASPNTSSQQQPTSQADQVQQVIGKQQFFGSWLWDDALFKMMKINHNGIALDEFGGDKNIAATALTIAWFRIMRKGDKDVWEFVVAKAEQWLSACLPEKFGSVDVLIAKAAEILPTKMAST